MTRLLTSAGSTAAATQLLPAPDGEAEETPEKKKRSPWTWPLIALIILLLLVLGGTIAAIVANQGGEEPTASTSTPRDTPTPTPTPTDTPTPTPTEERINVNDLGLVGKTCDEARGIVEGADLVASCSAGAAAPTADDVGLVYNVDPTGNVVAGATITMLAYGDQTALEAPTAPTLSATEVEPGGTVQVSWTGYACPAGEGSPSSYDFTASNGTFANGQSTSSFTLAQAPAVVTVPTTSTSGSVVVSYTVTCSGGPSGARTSPASSEVTAAIVAPAEDNSGEGGDGSGEGGGDDSGSGNG
ncbi:hypothetical protein GCM10010460_14190 [Microbacterium terrae]